MKKFLCFLMICMVFVGNAFAGVNVDTSNLIGTVVYEDDDTRLVLHDFFVVKSGSKYYSVIEFEYTNKSKKTNSFLATAEITQFQDGIELDFGILMDYSTETLTEIRPNKTLIVRDICQLRDTKNPIELVVDEYFDFFDTYDDFEIVLPLVFK